MANRENIQVALLARLAAQVSGLKTTTRYFLTFDTLAQVAQPALSVLAVSGVAQRQPGMPAKWTQHAMVVLYVRTPNEALATPETQLFALMEQVETALKRQPTEIGNMTDDFGTTLGGLVWLTHLSDWHLHHGLGEGQAAASLTIEMLSLS
jgi:hypothetical protein